MLKDDKWCFACGSQNPHGLQMADFDFDGETYTARWRPSKFHQGWADILHGGIVAAVLDEVMTRLVWVQGYPVATVEMTVRYHQQTPLDQELTARARQVSAKRRLFEVESELLLPDGTVTATATAKLLMPRDEQRAD